MRLPNHEMAYVPKQKLINYLLSDSVVLSRDLPDHGLKEGDIGAVVHSYNQDKAFEVEFITGKGDTIAVVTLNSEDVRLMQDKEILHVRKLQAA